MLTKIFERTCNEIEDEYRKLGHTLDWRFLNTPKATLSHGPRIAFITLNPGGDTVRPDHGRESSEIGSAYIHEPWPRGRGAGAADYPPGDAPLQKQIQALFREIAVLIGEKPDYQSLMDKKSLQAHYIPFRSPSYDESVMKESREFAFDLWSGLMEHISPKLILTIGKETFKDFEKIFQRRPGYKLAKKSPPLETGWGNTTADVSWYTVPNSGTAVIAGFPHLSRFRIFDRRESKQQVDKILNLITEHMR